MTCAERRELNGLDGRPTVPFGPKWTVCTLALIVVADQLTKWWAWREVAQVRINFGGDPLVGPVIGAWYADPVTGAVLDLLGAALLALAIRTRLCHRHPVVLRAPAALAIGGWVSNLLDRLGMHRLTAPGSVRGAVDFVPIGKYSFNLADFFIVGATLVFLCAGGRRRAAAKPPAVPRPLRPPARIAAITGTAAIVAAVTLGATHYGGRIVPLSRAGVTARHFPGGT